MMSEQEKQNSHERFKELGALMNSGTLNANEWAELKGHLQNCRECRTICRQFQILAKDGMPMLAVRYSHLQEWASWEHKVAWRKLFTRIRSCEHEASSKLPINLVIAQQTHLMRKLIQNPLVRAVLAASFVLAVGLAGYRLGNRQKAVPMPVPASAELAIQKLAAEKKSVDELLEARTNRLTLLQEESVRKEQGLAKLRLALHTMEVRMNELITTNGTSQEQLRFISQQRDALSTQLRDAEHTYQKFQAEITSSRAERDKAYQQTTLLESRIDDLSAINRDQERKIKDQEQYLAADRDIRELMGARQLYIADVFDVDSGSRTRKPYGRVFYTQGKSLIFYAFDLDRQPGLKEASTFQAWGRRETPQGEQSKPLSLGILYMDNAYNRRWVMRCNDPKQLAEIDAVFVTVEPRGGSQKPTGKPLLYALLRKEVNHP